LLTKSAPDGALVWATRLTNGAPLAGARAEFYSLPTNGQPALLSSANIDAGGLASVPIHLGQPRPEKMAVVVESGDDWAYQTVQLPEPHHPVGMIFTGRGVYRPGENVEIKGIARLPITTGLVTPKQGEVQIRLLNPDRREVARARKSFSRFGTFSAELPVPEDGALIIESRPNFRKGGCYRPSVSINIGRLKTKYSCRPINHLISPAKKWPA
jgi:alpha-2-macroglobulin